MIAKIKNNLLKDFQNLSYNLSNWNDVLDSSSEVTVFHLKSSVEYYSRYFNGEDISFVILESNKPLCIFPIFAYQNQDEWIITSNELGLIAPLFVEDISKKLKKRLESQIEEIVDIISHKLNIKKITVFEHSNHLSNWYLNWLRRAASDFITYQIAVDLQNTIENIRLGFRKSYKPLVNKALKEWNVEICNNNIEEVFEEFKALHLEVAGRQTRNEQTWNIQKEQIKNNEAFLVTVRDGFNLIGGGLFIYSRDLGLYSVGAYKRELFEKPIGHAVQMIAIKKLKEIGCKQYLLGSKATNLSVQTSSSKELSISYFKEGFASYLYAQPHLEVIMNE